MSTLSPSLHVNFVQMTGWRASVEQRTSIAPASASYRQLLPEIQHTLPEITQPLMMPIKLRPFLSFVGSKLDAFLADEGNLNCIFSKDEMWIWLLWSDLFIDCSVSKHVSPLNFAPNSYGFLQSWTLKNAPSQSKPWIPAVVSRFASLALIFR